MQKIPTIFKRNFHKTYAVTSEINPQCQWVFDGEGVPYRKYQGMSVLLKNNIFYKRTIIKPNILVPDNFILIEIDFNSGKSYGWLPINFRNPMDKYHKEAVQRYLKETKGNTKDLEQTFELIGPKILGNYEKYSVHKLIPHNKTPLPDFPRNFSTIKKVVNAFIFEGIVFHHPDGRMAKIKKKDFGFIR